MEIPVLLQVDTCGIKNPVGICVQKQHQRPGNPTRVSLTPSLQHGAGISTHGISTTAPGLIPKNLLPAGKATPTGTNSTEMLPGMRSQGNAWDKSQAAGARLVPRANPESIGLGYHSWSSFSFPVFLTQPCPGFYSRHSQVLPAHAIPSGDAPSGLNIPWSS